MAIFGSVVLAQFGNPDDFWNSIKNIGRQPGRKFLLQNRELLVQNVGGKIDLADFNFLSAFLEMLFALCPDSPLLSLILLGVTLLFKHRKLNRRWFLKLAIFLVVF